MQIFHELSLFGDSELLNLLNQRHPGKVAYVCTKKFLSFRIQELQKIASSSFETCGSMHTGRKFSYDLQ
jgi:hypothetical protein